MTLNMIISLARKMTIATELLTIRILKEEGFKFNLKTRRGVSLPCLDREQGQCAATHLPFSHSGDHTQNRAVDEALVALPGRIWSLASEDRVGQKYLEKTAQET